MADKNSTVADINAANPDVKPVDNTNGGTPAGNPAPETQTETEGGVATLDPEEEIVVNPLRPDIKVKRKYVVETEFHVDGMVYHPNKDREDPTKPGTFSFNTMEGVPGVIPNADNTGLVIINNHRSFPLSEWGAWPTFRRDVLLSFVTQLMRDTANTDASKFNSEFQHAMDGVTIKAVFIKNPAGVPFTNPWSSEAKPSSRAYETHHVFAFIKGFRFDLEDARHRSFIKGIYDGMPMYDKDKLAFIPRITPIMDDPETFVRLTLIKGGYIAPKNDEDVKMFIKSLAFRR